MNTTKMNASFNYTVIILLGIIWLPILLIILSILLILDFPKDSIETFHS